jgi:hypothetical protein
METREEKLKEEYKDAVDDVNQCISNSNILRTNLKERLQNIFTRDPPKITQRLIKQKKQQKQICDNHFKMLEQRVTNKYNKLIKNKTSNRRGLFNFFKKNTPAKTVGRSNAVRMQHSPPHISPTYSSVSSTNATPRSGSPNLYASSSPNSWPSYDLATEMPPTPYTSAPPTGFSLTVRSHGGRRTKKGTKYKRTQKYKRSGYKRSGYKRSGYKRTQKYKRSGYKKTNKY